MRRLGCIFFLFGLVSLAHAIYDHERGVADPFLRPWPIPKVHFAVSERWDKSPELFRALWRYEFVSSLVFSVGGLILVGVGRRMERSDPFSPDFAGAAALRECERVLDAELEKKHRPLR